MQKLNGLNTQLRFQRLEPRRVLDSTVVFNEIMYNPAGASEAAEWIELHNQMAVDMNLSQWSLADGLEYTFPKGTIVPGGGYLVVAASPELLQPAVESQHVFGPWEGRLDNGGEQIELRNHTGRLMDTLRYDDESDWPLAADGGGFSLAKLAPQSATAPARNWAASARHQGTPGQPNFTDMHPSRGSLRFSEVSGRGAELFFIELHNDSSTPWSLADHSLVRQRAADTDFSFGDVEIPADQYMSLGADQLPFDLVEGDRVHLIAEGDDRAASIDAVAITSQPQARSAEHDDRWQSPSRPTPGAANEFAFNESIVINEIMYHARPTYAQAGVFGSDPVMPLDATWQFNQTGTDLGTAWRDPQFDDTQWETGSGLFFRESAELPGPKSTPLQFGHKTYYFRTSFQWDPDASSAPLQFRHIVDDGAVFYLNGIEFGRFNMPTGELSYDTLAQESVNDATLVGPVTIPAEHLKAGTNTIAVEVHQRNEFSPDIVFGAELFVQRELVPATPYQESDEEWIEFYNRGSETVDLSGWQLADAVQFDFPDGTLLQPDQYLLVAQDAVSLAAMHPDVQIAGEFEGRLSNSNERLQLLDANGNLADELHYFDGGRWPEYADRGGSSLELRNPHADNSKGEAWASSDETDRTDWTHVSYTATVAPIVHDPPINFHEFVMGLIAPGEILIDNISVLENPESAGTELIQNGTFDNDDLGQHAQDWRLVGTHEHSKVIQDPDQADNRVLHLVAESRMNYLSNHAETTLANGARVVDGRTYRISYDAKWISGSPQLHTELYYKDAARTTILRQPDIAGTPGARNSMWQENIGPTFEALQHDPPIPSSSDSVTVSVAATDPDGLSSIALRFATEGRAPFGSVPMTPQGDGTFVAQIPPHDERDVVQFYVEATDEHGAVSYFPAGGADSRALYRVVDDVDLGGPRHDFRIVMTRDDSSELSRRTNMMDNNRLGSTVIYNGTDVFYDVGTRLKGSMFSRQNLTRTGYNVRFAPDQLFRGVHETVRFDQNGESEILVKYFAAAIGNLGGTYEDAFELTTPSGRGGGPTLTFLSAHDDLFLREQFENGQDGTLYKMEGIRVMQATVDGDPESLKLYQPIGWVSRFDIEDLGNDKELYRWPYLIHNNRDRDNFQPVIEMAKAFSLQGDALQAAVDDLLDVDQWMSTFAIMSLFGIGDAYSQGNPHNLNFYHRPADGKLLAMPWDWDFVFSRSATAPLHGNKNIGKVLELPAMEHAFLGQLHHMATTLFTTDEMAHWTDHFGDILRISMRSALRNIERRRQFVLGQLPPEDVFQIGSDPLPIESTVVIDATTPAQLLIPQPENGGDQLGNAWTQPDFVTTDAWQGVPAAIGFEVNPRDFSDIIEHDAIAMHDVNASAFLRIPFQLNDDQSADRIKLRMKVDDGFVAYLNGTRVASQNAPTTLEWNSSATASVRSNEAVEFVEFDISQHASLIQSGQNVLAIHALNRSEASTDFLNAAQLAIETLPVLPDKQATVDDNTITLEGLGWINVHEIRLEGSSRPLDVDWTDTNEWETEIAVRPGTHPLVLKAYDLSGNLVGEDRIEVTSTQDNPLFDHLRISEVMYHASAPSDEEQAAGFSDDDQFDYLEVVNVSATESLDLQGVRLEGAIAFQFPNRMLAPGEVAVVVDDAEAFSFRYGQSPTVIGTFDGRLGNAGEVIRLMASTNATILDFSYADDGPWPEEADGEGLALTISARETSPDGYRDVNNWQASTPSPGTHRSMAGDVNQDGHVDAQDLDLICAALHDPGMDPDGLSDLDQNGTTDLNDHRIAVEQILGTSYGDANLDGIFNSRDIVRVFQTGEYEDDVQGNSGWSEGDWNCDREFSSADIVLAFQRGNYMSAAIRAAAGSNRAKPPSW